MKSVFSCFLLLCSLPWLGRAAVPPAERLLPADTLAVFTVPDWQQARTNYQQWPVVQFWQSAEMRPFRDKFLTKFTAEAIVPLEKELGIKLADYQDLVQGQLTVALTQNGWTGQEKQSPGVVLFIDAKDKTPQLQQKLTDLKKRWVDAGKQIKTEKVRDVEFTTLILQTDDLAKTLQKAKPASPGKTSPDGGDSKPAGKTEICIGQTGSLLLVGSDPKVFEKILARLAGGTVPCLAEVPVFEANRNAMFRDAVAYGWANFRILADILVRQAAAKSADGAPQNPFLPQPDKILDAIGLRSLETLALSLSQSPQGLLAHLFVGVPEAGRNGVLKALAGEAKETAPPPFVPADVVKYNRWRMDGKKLWAAVQTLLTNISPALGNMMQMTLDTLDKAGKEKDPNFDLKGQLIGNLGDDIISFEKPPRSAKAGDLASPPALYLVGAINADQLVNTLKTAVGLMAPPGGNYTLTDREFLGRKIYTWPLPPTMSPDGSKPVSRSFSFASAGGYVAMSTDVATLEEYLRSNQSPARSLRDTAGLNEAAQKVGGLNTGFFGYENQSETLRYVFQTLKQDPDAFEKLFTSNLLRLPAVSQQDRKNREQWFDFSLLPAWETVAKYFYFSVYGGSANPQGLSYKVFSPVPPQLRK